VNRALEHFDVTVVDEPHWASRPYGFNSFTHMPSAVIGTSPGAIGTAVAQQSLRSVLSFCNSPQMNAPEAYIQFTPGLITDEGEVPSARRRNSCAPICRSSTISSPGCFQSCPGTPSRATASARERRDEGRADPNFGNRPPMGKPAR
jgi:hypothetical protein